MIAGVFLAALLWTAHPSDGVEMHLTREADASRLDFDFHGHAGYAIARARVDLDLPPNYQFTFRLRADAPPENLEFKLLNGDNVWWLNRRDFTFPRDWTTLKTKKRQIAFAWGPAGGGEIRHVESLEVVVTAGSGGRGTVWFTDPALESLPPTPTEDLHFTTNTIDLGEKREIGGLTIDAAGTPHVLVDGVPAHVVDGRFVHLPDAEARRITIDRPVKAVTVHPPGWAPAINDFYAIVAKHAERGKYPRYFLGEQTYWTVIGAWGANEEALISEDGAVEPFRGGYSIEPFLRVNGKRLTWADVTIGHSLAEGDLPIPTVTWRAKNVTLTITAAVSASSMLQLRYRVQGPATLELAWRNFQVYPSTQFLNVQGGVSLQPTNERTHIYKGDASLDIPLAKGATHEPLTTIASRWRERLHRVAIDIPAAPEIGNTIRTSIAYMLIEADGPALQPGSRAYERAWIRDGALMAALLLRLGHAGEAKRFAGWFATFQYPDGKIPCCVDKRGADPVPENDSHGEFIWLVAEIARLTHDEAFVRRMLPHVDVAARYIQKLRSENHGEFEGLVTESISHEGYSAKPMHSYWDDFFALRGIEDAARLAGHTPPDDFRRDVLASLRRTIQSHHIDYIPGAAELGDFDATSTAIAISPLNFAPMLPQRELHNTFDRYLANLQKPREDYTPYETRIIGALIRMGRRDDALPLIDRFLRDRRPKEWNGWAEVVRTDPRKPGFIGDMPHAWVASDFVRSILDAFCYEEDDGTLVIGAGIDPRWMAKPVHVGPILTSRGPVDIRIENNRLAVAIDGRPATSYELPRDRPLRLRVE